MVMQRLWLLILCVLCASWRCQAASFDPIHVMCEINGFLVPAIIDTAAEVTVMSTSCAKRCRVSSLIDTQHSGKAIGVGSSEIVGGINGLNLRIGPLNFQNKISVLRNSRCDLLIGLDILKRFQCEISFRERLLRLHVRGDEVHIPLLSNDYEEEHQQRQTELQMPSDTGFEEEDEDVHISDEEAVFDDEDEYDTYIACDDHSVSMEGV